MSGYHRNPDWSPRLQVPRRFFLSLPLSFPPFLSFLLSVSFLSGRNAASPLICSRNKDGEFQRESSSSADARCPTSVLPLCSLVPCNHPSLLIFFPSYSLSPHPKTLSRLILVCLSVLAPELLSPPLYSPVLHLSPLGLSPVSYGKAAV